MIGIVIVSHSEALANSIVELTKMMADGAHIAAAGGLEDGSFGTSYDRIKQAIESVYTPDGVVILMDMGSAVMTTEMVLEEYEDKKIQMVDAPIVEGAIVATVDAVNGSSMEEMLEDLSGIKSTAKFTIKVHS